MENEQVVSELIEDAKDEIKKENFKQAQSYFDKYLEKVNFELRKRGQGKINLDALMEMLTWFLGAKLFKAMVLKDLIPNHRIIPRIYFYFMTQIQACGDNKDWLEKVAKVTDDPKGSDDSLDKIMGKKFMELLRSE